MAYEPEVDGSGALQRGESINETEVGGDKLWRETMEDGEVVERFTVCEPWTSEEGSIIVLGDGERGE